MAVGDENNDVVEQLITSASALGNNTIDLNRKSLRSFPKEVLDLQQLEFLYLEGNAISEIPEQLFNKLPNLKWLDLRNNFLTELPSSVGKHRSLRNLLLEGNRIAALPLELGLVKSLSGLNLTSNPLNFPPVHILEKGTQEILKFLRDQFFLEQGNNLLQDDGRFPSGSISEESFGQISDGDSMRVVMEEEEEELLLIYKDEERKRLRLPPIIQAASRPRNLTRSNEAEGLLRGQKARRFEPERKFQMTDLKPKSPKRRRQDRQPSKQNQYGYFEIKDQRQELGFAEKRKSKERYRNLEEKEGGYEKYVDGDGTRRKRVEKLKITKRKFSSPTEERKGTFAAGNVQSNPETSAKKLHYTNELKDITSKTNEMRMADNPKGTILSTEAANSRTAGLTKIENNSRTLNEGDYVAIKVPEKLYIKGQPCLGRVTSLPDSLGLITVHYYTGSYGGFWRPMMSRTSPYLRKVPLTNVLCKFTMSDSGKMSPMTAAKVKEIVDGVAEKS